jgi:phosphatidylinositol-3-phosphatase
LSTESIASPPLPAAAVEPCATCGAALAADQRYCLQCGTRRTRCHDGSPGPCPGGAPGGLPAANGFLEQVVPQILVAKAYKESGLLLITTDEAPSSGGLADSSSCCGQSRFPNLPAPSGVAASLPPEGGGQVGALLLSPFVKPRTISQEPYDHFSLLRTIEDIFALKHLGYAGDTHVSALEPSLFVARQR